MTLKMETLGDSNENELLDIQKMKVADLKKELKARGLSTVGNKSDLLERLQEALQSGDHALESGEVEEEEEETAEDYVLEDDVLADDTKVNDGLDTSFQEDGLNSTEASQQQSSCLSILMSPNDPLELEKSISPLTVKQNKDENILSVKKVQSLTEEQKLELRSKKFNLPPSEDDRKKARALRFGITSDRKVLRNTSLSGNVNSEKDLLVKRAERFGMPLPKSAQQKIDQEKIRLRAERFGSAAVKTTEEEKVRLVKRRERFGIAKKDDELEIKKQKRAERFGLI